MRFFRFTDDFLGSDIVRSEVVVKATNETISTLRFFYRGKLVHIREEPYDDVFAFLDRHGFTLTP